MSTERAELPGEDAERGWRDRFEEVSATGRVLLATRLAILREELAGKARLAAIGIAAMVVAAALGIGALLLAAALIAALFAKLTNSVVLGILAAVVLYGVGAGVAAWLGIQKLSRVRPSEFPATSAELSRDWQAISTALAPETPSDPDDAVPPGEAKAVADLEERLRGGTQ